MTNPPSKSSAEGSPKRGLGLTAATALGVGGMMGAGLYTLLGLAANDTGVLLPLAFLLAGFAAAFSVYSYTKLGETFPSSGGAAEFLRRLYGTSTASGGLNVFQFCAYLIATSLYAAGFAEYVAALAGDAFPEWAQRLAGAAIVVVFFAVNVVGSRLVGRAETVIVGVETAIILIFLVVGFFHADPSRLTDQGTPSALGVITGAALLYVTYQGFGVVTNASGEMLRPRWELPRAMYLALGVVAGIYLAVSTLVVTLLPLAAIEADAGHVLANAGEAIAGRVGFVVIGCAAILATSSAVNATMFAASSVGLDVAQHRQLPAAMAREVRRDVPVSLLVSAAIIVLLVLFFPLSAVGQMTSLAFLVVYGAVSFGHIKLRATTGARGWPLVVAVVLNAALFLALLIDAVRTGPASTWITLLVLLVGSFVFAAVYRRRVGPLVAS